MIAGMWIKKEKERVYIRLWIILLMDKILHQLIGSLSHYLKVIYIPGGAGFLPSTV